MSLCSILPALLLLLVSPSLHAQLSSDTILSSRSAVPLRKVWERIGLGPFSFALRVNDNTIAWWQMTQLASGFAEGNWYRWEGDSVRKFQRTDYWMYGGPSGRFYGTDTYYPVLGLYKEFTPQFGSLILSVVEYTDTGFTSVPLSSWRGDNPDSVELDAPVNRMVAADLDRDGADELIAFYTKTWHPSFDSTGHAIPYGKGPSSRPSPVLRIWRGGPNFSLNTPSLEIEDTLHYVSSPIGRRDPYEWRSDAPPKLIVGRLDNDTLPDIATIAYYGDIDTNTLFFSMNVWFGNSNHLWNGKGPDRQITFPGIRANFVYDLAACDIDGDSVLDIAVSDSTDGRATVLLFLSSSGKKLSTRSFARDDADQVLVTPYRMEPRNWGYIADSGKRFAMLGLGPSPLSFIPEDSAVHYGLRGGTRGAERLWSATATRTSDTLGRWGFYTEHWETIGDATGDGWEDLYATDSGYAALYAGGPYIPNDPAAGVQWISIAGEHERAVATWPSPARDEVHIAWRGDLSHMPRRFTVYNANGRIVDQWEAESYNGETVWHPGTRAGGVYTCLVEDYTGVHVASVPIVIVP